MVELGGEGLICKFLTKVEMDTRFVCSYISVSILANFIQQHTNGRLNCHICETYIIYQLYTILSYISHTKHLTCRYFDN